MLLEQLLNGLTLGGIYAIVALGFTLVFGVLDIINMAHGEIFMFGAFIGVVSTDAWHLPIWAAFVAAMIVTALLGYFLEIFALRPLRKKKGVSHLASLISTIAVSIMLENLTHQMFGSGNRPFRNSFAAAHVQVGPITIYVVQLVIFAISVLLMASLAYWLARTKAGKALRATAENREIAGLLGIHTRRMITMTVVIASAMGGVAGVLVGMAFNSVNPEMGLSMGLKGLAIIILGGMGSVRGAMAGGLILGLSETFVVVYGHSGYKDAIAFIAIIMILLMRPQGLFGSNVSETRR
ncbi:MAG TPA: branched-chain amino acid ABC transporter permease [Bacilli bacterium]